MLVQIHKSASSSTTTEHLPFLQNLLNFIITKYLKQKVDDDLSICVDERCDCGLFITEDVEKCPREVPMDFYQVVFTAKI